MKNMVLIERSSDIQMSINQDPNKIKITSESYITATIVEMDNSLIHVDWFYLHCYAWIAIVYGSRATKFLNRHDDLH